MADPESLTRALTLQAGVCTAMGSAFSGALLERAAADVAEGGATRNLFAPWEGASTRSLIADAVTLRLLGALHDLALSGEDPALAAAYPTAERPGDPRAAWAAGLGAMAEHPARFAGFMAHEPQTNEVRRSACLLGGFLDIARRTGLPLRAFEIAASAGLNQLWDRYRYRLGEADAWGDPKSSVLIDTDWRGPLPSLDARVSVIERAACDRKPVDITDPLARRRLRAFIWPDQIDRLQRLDAALEAALAAGVTVEREDAVSWAARRAMPREGAATVLFHSVFWQYMPAESQAALTGVIADLGALATASGPFAWLRMEPPPDNLAAMEVRLTLWPGGEERLLALVHPHGAWVEWKDDGAA
jgi:hypothetical protein